MRRLVAVELDKALRNRWFAIAVGIGVALACYSAVACARMQSGTMMTLSKTEWLGLGATGAFNGWLPTAVGDMFASDLFFLLVPLLAVIPYAWSMRSEMVSGAFAQQLVRATRAKVLGARYVAVFVSGALVILTPMLVDFVVLLCLVPASTPEVSSNIYIGMPEYDMWARLFFSQPWVYVIAQLAADTVLTALWAGLVLALSVLIDNRVVLLAGSFLLSVVMELLNVYLFKLLHMNGFAFNLTHLLHRANGSFARTPFGAAVFVLATAAVSFGLLTLQKRRDVL